MVFNIGDFQITTFQIGATLVSGFAAFAVWSIGKDITFHFKSDVKKCESPIEVQMYKALHKQGIKAIPQYPVDRCRIDLGIVQNGKKIGVECDGAAYHSSPEQIERDQRRDAFLESRGWNMVRFTGSQIYNDADGCAKYVKRLISGREKSSA